MNKTFQAYLAVQQQLKAPKNGYNDFGKYHYRSAESILEAARPLANAHGAVILLTDEVVILGEARYVKAVASLIGEDGRFEAVAYAREPDTKKGMDPSQITGGASSYARKYALAGLFAISGEKDADDVPCDMTSLLLELARETKRKGISPESVKARMVNLFGKDQARDLSADEVRMLLHEVKGV